MPAQSPQVQSPNVLTLDYQDNPELRDLFGAKGVGDECKLTLELRIMSKYPEGVQASIEKVISESGEYGETEEKEVEATAKQPIMAAIKRKGMKSRGMGGPHAADTIHGRPPQTAENSQEPWMTSYV